jgi:hypothetical protein
MWQPWLLQIDSALLSLLITVGWKLAASIVHYDVVCFDCPFSIQPSCRYLQDIDAI